MKTIFHYSKWHGSDWMMLSHMNKGSTKNTHIANTKKKKNSNKYKNKKNENTPQLDIPHCKKNRWLFLIN